MEPFRKIPIFFFLKSYFRSDSRSENFKISKSIRKFWKFRLLFYVPKNLKNFLEYLEKFLKKLKLWNIIIIEEKNCLAISIINYLKYKNIIIFLRSRKISKWLGSKFENPSWLIYNFDSNQRKIKYRKIEKPEWKNRFQNRNIGLKFKKKSKFSI